jgi:AraC-like DNA-binding protein
MQAITNSIAVYLTENISKLPPGTFISAVKSISLLTETALMFPERSDEFGAHARAGFFMQSARLRSTSLIISENGVTAAQTWDCVNAQIQNHLGVANAFCRRDTLDEFSVHTTNFWIDREFSIIVSGPATFCLSIILEGEIASTLDSGEQLLLTPGSAVIFASDRPSGGQNRFKAGQHLRLVDIRFNKQILEMTGGMPYAELARELLGGRDDSGAAFVAFPADNEILRIAEQVFDCKLTENGARRLFLQGKAFEMLALSLVRLRNDRARLTLPNDHERMERARQLLYGRFSERWTIASLAKAAGISEKKLKQGFPTVAGNSIHGYLRSIRLMAAAKMLGEGRTVTDVALSVGYDNLSHFSKIFRAAYGVNPSEYPN